MAEAQRKAAARMVASGAQGEVAARIATGGPLDRAAMLTAVVARRVAAMVWEMGMVAARLHVQFLGRRFQETKETREKITFPARARKYIYQKYC